jgi:hypothetical protein
VDGACPSVRLDFLKFLSLPHRIHPAIANGNIRKGEMFDLEALSKTCAELKRYSFFLTSMPLNMPGGVSSPPNSMAIF